MILSLLVIRRLRIAAFVAAGVLAALAPVVVRNAAVAHQFALAGSQGGLNFYIGNHAGGDRPVRRGARRAREHGRAVGRHAQGRRAGDRTTLTDAQVSGYFTGLALDWIRAHPGAAAALFARKLALVFNARHQWLDFSYPYYAYDTGSILWASSSGRGC